MQKAQYGILRFAKYKGSEIGNIEAHNERTKEKYASNQMWTLLAASTIFIWSNRRANTEQSPRNKSPRQAAKPERTEFASSKPW